MSRIEWTGTIADTRTAIQASGGIEGGARVVFDVPEIYAKVLGELIAVRGQPLLITIEPQGKVRGGLPMPTEYGA